MTCMQSKSLEHLCKMIVEHLFKAGLPHYTDDPVGCWTRRTNAVHVPRISRFPHNLDSRLLGLAQRPGDRKADRKVCCLEKWVNTASSGQLQPGRAEAWPCGPRWQQPLATELLEMTDDMMTVSFCPVPPPLLSL